MTDVSTLAVPDTMDLLRPVLPPAPAAICEVGCGRGALAAALGDAGYRVTGLEPDDAAATVARDRGVTVLGEELLAHHPAHPYDVVLFTRSLHHVDDLSAAVAHAVALLTPGGTLIAEEFARERADRAAASFLFDTLDLLAAAGVAELPPADDSDHASADHNSADHDGVGPAADPLRRWMSHFHHRAPGDDGPPPPLHDTSDIVEALRGAGLAVADRTTPTLWRMIGSGLLDTPAAAAIVGRAREVERRRIAEGSLPALGRFLVATHPGAGRLPALPRGR